MKLAQMWGANQALGRKYRVLIFEITYQNFKACAASRRPRLDVMRYLIGGAVVSVVWILTQIEKQDSSDSACFEAKLGVDHFSWGRFQGPRRRRRTSSMDSFRLLSKK